MSGFLALNIAAITAREPPEASDDGKSFWCEAPLGWKKRVTYRSSPTANNKCKADVYFYAPSDSIQTTRFRSEKKLREYLLKNTGLIPDLPSPEAFDWSYPGGTREGKCKNGPPLSFKAAPDTPRHAPVKTTGKRDPRKRPRDSPKGGVPMSEEPQVSGGGAANGASERANGSDVAQPLDESSDGQEAKMGEKELGESNGDGSRSEGNEAGPLAEKKKGSQSEGRNPVEEKDVQSKGSTAGVESMAKKPGTRTESEKGAGLGGGLRSTEPKDKGETSAVQQQEPGLTRSGEKQLLSPPAPPKRKGRPPRVKKDGVEVEKSESVGAARSGEPKKEETRRQSPSEGAVKSTCPSLVTAGAALIEPADENTVRGDATSDENVGADQARPSADRGGDLQQPKEQPFEGDSKRDVPQSDSAIGPAHGKKPATAAVLKRGSGKLDGGKSRGGSEGLLGAMSKGELANGNAEDQENRAEFRKRAPVDPSKAEIRLPLSETEEKQLPGRVDIKVEKEKVGGCSKGSTLEISAEVKVESVCAEVGDEQAQESADGNGTPLSILDRAGNGGVDTGAKPTPTEERSPVRNPDGEEPPKAPAESPELQCSESVPSPEQTASGDPIETAPSANKPEVEATVTKAMRKKARLAKVLGPHEVLERPRRERATSGPPPSAPRGIADAVKLRTAGLQAEKKTARQQAGGRFYANRMPPGLSVSAVIAAAAAAPPSPVPKIRGRPPKQKNGVGTSRLGGGKQTEEDAEEKRAQQLREEHDAAVKIFQEEEAERDRVLKERGWFHPPDETLADRPKLPPLKGKRRTKSALVAEHWERLAQAKLERGENDSGEWLLPEDDDDDMLGERHCGREVRGAETNGTQMDVRMWMKRGRSATAGDESERGNGLDASEGRDTWGGEKSHVRKKRKAGWTAVRTQKRTALANRGGDAGPSHRRPSQHPRAHCPFMPSDPEPDPAYDSDANSSELKMGQKLDEHGFFERDDFEVASHEPSGRKPPRERLPLEAPPQRRRSFGHRKGPSGVQAREGVRKPVGADVAADVAVMGSDVAADVGGQKRRIADETKQAVDEKEQRVEENGNSNGGGGASVGAFEPKAEVQEEAEKETKRLRWEGAWGAAAGAGPLLDNGMNVPAGRRSAEPLTPREHFAAAPTLTSF